MKLDEYRIMWILVLFDLPTDTKKDIRNYTQFRKAIMKDGFNMFQFSIYLRHCPSKENSDVHVRMVKSVLPPKGHVGILRITDKQFGEIEIFYGKKQEEVKAPPQQLEMF
jgi:CRISPR-associated protein Cas2